MPHLSPPHQRGLSAPIRIPPLRKLTFISLDACSSCLTTDQNHLPHLHLSSFFLLPSPLTVTWILFNWDTDHLLSQNERCTLLFLVQIFGWAVSASFWTLSLQVQGYARGTVKRCRMSSQTSCPVQQWLLKNDRSKALHHRKVCVCVYACVSVFVCLYVCVSMCICMHVCV